MTCQFSILAALPDNKIADAHIFGFFSKTVQKL